MMMMKHVSYRLRDFLELKKTTLSMVILFEAENGDNARMVSFCKAIHIYCNMIVIVDSANMPFI